ncbi:FecR domain-containing protein [Bradyrhizobium uaiense]|uniref:FecR domain-containing protein n=1 Tax=Bradyrhizobium uaiense TaxID=2594946 RepID=UPI0015814342
MRIRFIVELLASILLTLVTLSGQVLAQTEPAQPAVENSSAKLIGKVVTASGSVTIEHPGAVVVQAALSDPPKTKVGDPVYLGDVVQTGADGRVGINFTDGTSFNLSSNAKMAMTEFVYDPNGKSNSTLFKLANGTFTFVAGNIAKTGDMKIDTPAATMGIRGTTPRIEISDDGTVRFATLVEEGKSKLLKKPATRASQPEQNTYHRFNPNICRGC